MNMHNYSIYKGPHDLTQSQLAWELVKGGGSTFPESTLPGSDGSDIPKTIPFKYPTGIE